ncbi:MAG: FAD-dependent oxidoreductase [Termitinemataceae bacterium]
MGESIKIVVIGGGYGGIEAAKKLAKHFKKRDDISITLIDKNPFHTLMTELHEVAGHRVEPDSVRIPFAKIFGASKVKVVLDKIETVDFKTQEAISATAKYRYDYLVIGSGAEPEFFGVPGVKEHSFTLWSFNDAIKLRHHIERTFERAVAVQDSAIRKRMLTFVVAGAGFTGIEMAGELLEWRDTMCEKWLISREEVRVMVIEALPNILPILEEDLRAKVERYLKKHQVELLTNTPIVGAEPGIVKLKDGSAIETDTFIWTCGVQGCHFAGMLDLTKGRCGNRDCEIMKAHGTCGLADCKFKKEHRDVSGKKGRILVNEEMRSIDYQNVYLVGDNIWFLENNKPLPQIVETALQTADVAAHNIAAAIEGTPVKTFKSNYHGFMVSVGGKYAVSNAGGMKLSGFFAMAMKHLVNLHYLWGVAGINQCWEYLKHEFLDIQTHRNLVRGFGSYRTRGYWILPLRLWLGLMWVMEGVNKIGEGWLAWGSGSKSTWMFSPGVHQAGTAAAPAAAAALGAAEAAVEAVSASSEVAADTAGQAAQWATTAASTAADAVAAASEQVAEAGAAAGAAAAETFGKIWDLSKPIFNFNGPVATWFRTTFMDGIASHIPFQAFQLMVVAAEIGIGLALMGGLFTWWAAAASIVMCVVFTLSGMFSWDQVWFIFAAFLMLGGAGRAFGLDCWVVPFFKKWWNGLPFVRRHYLYLDNPSKKD